MPKFALVTPSRSFVQLFEALGMKAAFDFSAADFHADDPSGNLFIKEVFHAASVAVDEKGTKASAASGVVISVDAGIPAQPPPVVTLDRPFLFVVRDRPTRAILFMGRVGDPTGP